MKIKWSSWTGFFVSWSMKYSGRGRVRQVVVLDSVII